MSAEDQDSNDDTSHSRRGEKRDWFLLNGDRLHITGLTAIVIFAFLVTASVSSIAEFRDVQPLFYVFSGLMSGNLTLITVVVAINQLLLSREFNTPRELETQMEGVIDYRSDVEDISGRVAPVEPSGFLRLLVESTREEAQRLGGLTISDANEEIEDEIDPIVSELTDSADRIDMLIKKSEKSTFEALSTTLTTNYARQINELRRIEMEHGVQLPGHVRESIDELIHRLKDIDVARQYFKSVYLQEELATVSRLLFYVGIGSLVVVATALLMLTTPGGASVPRSYLPILVPAAITAGLLPVTLLFAFFLRIATVTQRTAAILPFTTPAQEK